MRKSLLFILSLLPYLCLANPVSESQARQKAQAFLNSQSNKHQGTTRAMSNHLQLIDTHHDQLFVFNTESSDGFVIISANDQTPSVLGYSDTGSISAENMPPQLVYWLDEINRQVKAVGNGWAKSAMTRSTTHEAIAPMVTSKWNQSAPYNLRVATSSNQYVTGCMATAMAQILYYHKFPEQVTERVPSPGAALIDLEPTTFNWELMRDEYNKDDTDEGAQEVAKLMAYCGYATQMDYDMGSSGAHEINAAEGLRRFLGSDKTTEVIYRANYTSQQWDDIIYQELEAQRPVLYCGYAAGGGHAFVCDGYDGNGYYHINWGWGGYSDAYFLLSVMNPEDQGIGGAPGEDGYSIWQSAIVGIQKTQEPYEIKRLTTSRVFTQTPDIQRASTSDNFSLKAYAYLYNYITPEEDGTFDLAFGLYQGETLLKIFEGTTNKTIKSSKFAQLSNTMLFGKDLADGIYQIRALQRVSGTSEWLYASLSKAVFLQLQIAGTRLISTEIDASSDITKISTTLEVMSASVNGDAYAQNAVEIIASVKNTGNQNTGVMDLEIAKMADFSDATLISRVGVNIDPGQTEDVTIHFTPEETGTFYLRLVNFKDDTVLKELTVQVVNAPPVILQCSGSIENTTLKSNYQNYYDVDGNTLKPSLLIKNLGSAAYKNYVYVYIFSKLPEEQQFQSSTTYKVAYVELEPGESKTYDFEFSNLAAGRDYAFSALYTDKGERKQFTDVGFGIYLVSDDTGVSGIKADSLNLTIYDLHGRNWGTNPTNLPKGIYIIGGKKTVVK
ncbi:C10 family peptidase [Prevotella sp. P6B1]|uniref:C10 family peptidase n=1 Tax=Prevotella sp. P6B1 TaxID=1410613 RepID=UPI00051BA075|nr:C10 family peptidase [Prevotella sp. P6B1]